MTAGADGNRSGVLRFSGEESCDKREWGLLTGAGSLRISMEKIERLAHLNPKTSEVSLYALEMFRVLRGYAILDWTLRHPNDLGVKRSKEKFEKLVEKTWALMDVIQEEVEGGEQFHREPDAGGQHDGQRLPDDH